MKTVFKTTNSAKKKKQKNNRENSTEKQLNREKIKHPFEVNKRLQKASASKEKSLSQNFNSLGLGKRIQ